MKVPTLHPWLAMVVILGCRAPATETPSAPAPVPTDVPLEGPELAPEISDVDDGSVPTDAGKRTGSARSQAEAEFLAWSRDDPEDEARRLAWDQTHFDDLVGPFLELACLRLEMLRDGKALLAGGGREEQWAAFKMRYAQTAKDQQEELFRSFPDVHQKSKAVLPLCAMYDWVAWDVPIAFEQQDRQRLGELDLEWSRLLSQLQARAVAAGRSLDVPDAESCSRARGA